VTTTVSRPVTVGPGGKPRSSPRPRRRRWLQLAIAGAGLVVALVVWLVGFSPVLGVKQVLVRGVRNVTVEQVRAAARIGHGTPLARLDTAAVTRRVEDLPVVAAARVRVSYPSTVLITITERTAAGYVAAGSAAVLVDPTGHQYLRVPQPPRGPPRFDIPLGGSPATGRALATAAAALTPGLRARIGLMQAQSDSSIVFVLTDHRVVLWGSADRSAQKANVLSALLNQPGTQFDISDPDVAVVR
jgi:cell division protein FtsQ